jgi:HPt (histidine-containing phosphotransfer) domain-containing protein
VDGMTDEGEMFARMRERARGTNLARTDQIEPGLADGAARDLVDDARAVAHSVAGAAGTFGYAEASRLAHQIELALEDALSSDSPPPAALRDHLAALRAELRPDAS